MLLFAQKSEFVVKNVLGPISWEKNNIKIKGKCHEGVKTKINDYLASKADGRYTFAGRNVSVNNWEKSSIQELEYKKKKSFTWILYLGFRFQHQVFSIHRHRNAKAIAFARDVDFSRCHPVGIQNDRPLDFGVVDAQRYIVGDDLPGQTAVVDDLETLPFSSSIVFPCDFLLTPFRRSGDRPHLD